MAEVNLAELLTGKALGISSDRLDMQGWTAASQVYTSASPEDRREMEVMLAQAIVRSEDWLFIADAIYLARTARMGSLLMATVGRYAGRWAPDEYKRVIEEEAKDYKLDVGEAKSDPAALREKMSSLVGVWAYQLHNPRRERHVYGAFQIRNGQTDMPVVNGTVWFCKGPPREDNLRGTWQSSAVIIDAYRLEVLFHLSTRQSDADPGLHPSKGVLSFSLTGRRVLPGVFVEVEPERFTGPVEATRTRVETLSRAATRCAWLYQQPKVELSNADVS